MRSLLNDAPVIHHDDRIGVWISTYVRVSTELLASSRIT